MADPLAGAIRFTRAHDGVEAVTQRIGAHSTQVILVASSGEWSRVVVESPEAARALCDRLGVPGHEGWPDDLRRRMTAWRRSPEDWARAPYPERGGAGLLAP